MQLHSANLCRIASHILKLRLKELGVGFLFALIYFIKIYLYKKNQLKPFFVVLVQAKSCVVPDLLQIALLQVYGFYIDC